MNLFNKFLLIAVFSVAVLAQNQNRTITVEGSASVFLPPDSVIVSVTLNRTASNVANALGNLTADVQSLINDLAQYNVSQDNVQVTYFNLFLANATEVTDATNVDNATNADQNADQNNATEDNSAQNNTEQNNTDNSTDNSDNSTNQTIINPQIQSSLIREEAPDQAAAENADQAAENANQAAENANQAADNADQAADNTPSNSDQAAADEAQQAAADQAAVDDAQAAPVNNATEQVWVAVETIQFTVPAGSIAPNGSDAANGENLGSVMQRIQAVNGAEATIIGFSASNQADAFNTARQNAFNDAKAKADALAGQAGTSTNGISNLVSNETYTGYQAIVNVVASFLIN